MSDALTPLSPEERDALKALEGKATPGPWSQGMYLGGGGYVHRDEDVRRGITAIGCLAECVTVNCVHNAAFIAAARSALPRLLAETERLREEIARLSKPTHFFNAYGWEYTTTDPDMLTDGLSVGEVMEVGRLVSLPNRFLARVPTALDEDGCAEEEELQWFDTEEEAKAALLAARQAGTAEGV